MTTTEFPEVLFQRQDVTPDEQFYAQPRLVTHIDDATIEALTAFYREFLPADSDLLDLMSSWISHLPEDIGYASVTGLGMNAAELEANPRLTQRLVQNLNTSPQLPFNDAEFDRAMIVVSVQYLIKPIEVMREVWRCLKPGGRLCIAMSHRCFPTKAIAAFQHMSSNDRIALVMAYLTNSGFADVEFIDRSPAGVDPLWLVVGTRS